MSSVCISCVFCCIMMLIFVWLLGVMIWIWFGLLLRFVLRVFLILMCVCWLMCVVWCSCCWVLLLVWFSVLGCCMLVLKVCMICLLILFWVVFICVRWRISMVRFIRLLLFIMLGWCWLCVGCCSGFCMIWICGLRWLVIRKFVIMWFVCWFLVWFMIGCLIRMCFWLVNVCLVIMWVCVSVLFVWFWYWWFELEGLYVMMGVMDIYFVGGVVCDELLGLVFGDCDWVVVGVML